MLNHKVDDTVRIHTQQWMDAQEKDNNGDIDFLHKPTFFSEMFCYSGKIAKITKVYNSSGLYRLDVDNGEWFWTDQMFDPDYRPEDEPLSAEDAIHAMLEGEVLYDADGNSFKFIEEKSGFVWEDDVGTKHEGVNYFGCLYRRPTKRKRAMTRWEILAWVNSEESRGWLVRSLFIGDAGIWRQWELPQYFSYDTCEGMTDDRLFEYQRARILPDHSGIDEDTIQGFEVEE
jgi:hypothetical protein